MSQEASHDVGRTTRKRSLHYLAYIILRVAGHAWGLSHTLYITPGATTLTHIYITQRKIG